MKGLDFTPPRGCKSQVSKYTQKHSKIWPLEINFNYSKKYLLLTLINFHLTTLFVIVVGELHVYYSFTQCSTKPSYFLFHSFNFTEYVLSKLTFNMDYNCVFHWQCRYYNFCIFFAFYWSIS